MINLQWGTQKNGQIDTVLLVDVSGRGDYLEPTAAAQYRRMRADLKSATGFDLQPAPGSSAYRPEAIQIEFFTERYTKVGYNTGLWWNGSYWTKKPGVAVAAIPDTSNHGWARACDFNISQLDRAAWAWMLAHAAEYGWSWATGKASGEDWHWECLTPPGTVVAGMNATALLEPTGPRPLTQEEIDEMTATPDARIIRDYVTENTTGKTTTALIYPDGTAVRLTDSDDVTSACAAFAKTYNLGETIDRSVPANKNETDPRKVFGVQLTKPQWAAFFKTYPASKKLGTF